MKIIVQCDKCYQNASFKHGYWKVSEARKHLAKSGWNISADPSHLPAKDYCPECR